MVVPADERVQGVDGVDGNALFRIYFETGRVRFPVNGVSLVAHMKIKSKLTNLLETQRYVSSLQLVS